MNNNVNVAGKGQRFFIGLILPIVPLFIWYFIFIEPFETIGWVFFVVAFCIIPLVFISLITETLQKYNTFLFFVFSVLVLLGYMCLTLLTAFLIVFFWSIVPGYLMTIPILRWHYLYHKQKAFIEIDNFNI
ncbi:MAG: hypothetical protein IJ780_00160 [Neisseriaceae bacterium]|nr:hypothetical protein [Neisseriaceae bacterium]MBR1818531.1 hypothetical protein [Neisseriaceae bacterium]